MSILRITVMWAMRAQIGQWLEGEYMQERIHSALAYATPAEFEAAFWRQQAIDLLND